MDRSPIGTARGPWQVRTSFRSALVACTVAITSLAGIHAQHPDPAWDPTTLVKPAHTPLAEEYVWTAQDAAVLRPDHAKFNYHTTEKKIEPHYFRAVFNVPKIPEDATLYVVGPRAVKAWINGIEVMDTTADAQSPMATHVFAGSIAKALHPGRNTIAMEAVRGRGIVAASDAAVVQQIAFGESLIAKIVPAAEGVDAPALLRTNPAWRSTTTAAEGWQAAGFDDAAWMPVKTLGAIESRAEFYQWNLDAGLYNWPGYMGMSPALRTYSVQPMAITHPVAQVSESSSSIIASWVLVDFGREIAGRLLVESAATHTVGFLASYGESEDEALSGKNYLGNFTVRVPPGGTARGPKSGFRYVWLRFFGNETENALRTIHAEGIAYPVEYRGSFRSSDPMLNRIWEAGAYTAHLCMQDGVWDAAKRDRGWWAGDLDVAGPVIASVFGESKLLNQTLIKLIPPRGENVNGIPSYSALWITALADLYRRTADPELLAGKHDALLALLARMDEEFDEQGKFVNKGHHWMFVDWSKDLYAFTPEAAEGTQFTMVRGYREGAGLLAQMGDAEQTAHYAARAEALAMQLRKQFANTQGSYGERWQMNAMAVLAGVAEKQDYNPIWTNSLSETNADARQTISPYFNDYVLQAMARMNRRADAVQWLRTYWGGMMDEGATSLWEAYDLHWPKQNPHKYLEADGRVGYFVSLAHAWSGGPTSWMMDELLGVHADAPGYAQATIRPELAGLQWIEGTVPTPHGAIHVSMHAATTIEVELPAGVEAELLVPLPHAGAVVDVNGSAVKTTPVEQGARAAVALKGPGTFEVVSR
jgi:hypothetical protein